MTGKTAQTAGVNHTEPQVVKKRAKTERIYRCIYCSYDTWERKRVETSSATYKCEWQNVESLNKRQGLKCTRCHSFMCSVCLLQAYKKCIGNESDYDFLKNYLFGAKESSESSYMPIPGEIASCCWMKAPLANWRRETKERMKDISSSVVAHGPEEIFPWDGSLVFPEFNLVIPTQLDNLDVHAMAQVAPTVKGVVHGVFDTITAAQLQNNGNVPMNNNSGLVFDRMIVFTDICGNNHEAKVRCVLLEQLAPFAYDLLGTHPSLEDGMNATTLCTKKQLLAAQIDGIDAHCIMGHRASNSHTFLLLLRFHSARFATPSFNKSTLRTALETHLSTYKMECRRWGGSNGIPKVDDDLMNFLHKAGTLPRKAVGCRIYPSGKKWRILYKAE